jgi:GNAT superfamily N-acetyltransferase
MTAALVIERHPDAAAFLATAESWLLEAEAENNLLLGIALSSRGRRAKEPPPYWASVHDSNGVVGCACRTPPYPLVLSRLPPGAVAPLTEDVHRMYSSLSGVHGLTADAEAFAGTWIAQHGGTSRTRFRMRLHELTRVTLAGPLPPGSLRKAVDADLPLAREWIDEYVRDTGIAPFAPDAQQLIGRGQLNFWLDGGGPCAMVASTRETRSACAINTVYTPPQFRRRGYATAAVATLSEMLLEAGRRFCCLYTDLANPTSNSIYAKIGYRPIRDDQEIELR